MNTPEDRLTGALNDRAAAARTSPDALDGVFRKVATHRRRTRAVAGAGLAVVLVAGTVVASAAVRQPGADSLQPTQPGPTSSATPQDEPSTSEPSTSPSPTPSVSATPSTPPGTYPKDSAVVLLADHRVAVVSTTTGEELDSLGTLPSDAEGYRLLWSREDRRVYFARSGCRVALLDAETGETRDVARGEYPALSPDGTRIATASCEKPEGRHGGDVLMTVVATGKETTYPGLRPYPPPDQLPSDSPSGLEWLDDVRLAVAVRYEEPGGLVILDTVKDSNLDEGERVKVSVDDPLAVGQELLGLSRFYHGTDTEPTKVVRWEIADKDPQTLLSFEVEQEVRDIDADEAGRVLILTEDGLWRWDRESAPKLVRRGATAFGG